MGKLIDAPPVETFEKHQGNSFSVESDAGGNLELTAVETADAPDGFDRFTLVFRGEADLESGTHRLSADGLDAFDVGLSPTLRLDPDRLDDPESEPVEYEAVFTRRSADSAERRSTDAETEDTAR